MRTPSSALPASPHGLVEGGGNSVTTPLLRTASAFCAVIFDVGLFAACFFATFFAAAFPAAFLRVAIAISSLFFANHALRVEVADATTLAAGRGVDHRVDEGRLAGVHRLVHGALELVGRRRMDADASKCLHHLVVARAFDEDGCRNVRTPRGVDVGSAVDAVVVEDDDADRKAVPADRFHFHSGETKGAVAFNREHGFAGLYCSRDGKAHADAHDAPGADVQAFARLIHVDDAAREIERIGALVDKNGIRPLFDDGPQHTERAVVVHRRRILHQPRRHLGDVLFPFRLDGAGPVGRRGRPIAAHALKKCGYAGTDVADHRSDDLNVAVHLLWLDVDLDEPL